MSNSNIKDRCDCSPGYKKLKVHKNLKAIWNYLLYAGLAQLGEHLPYKQRVGGSSPSLRTKVNIEEVMNESISSLRVYSGMRETLLCPEKKVENISYMATLSGITRSSNGS